MRDLPRSLRWYLWAIYLITAACAIFSAVLLLPVGDHWQAGPSILLHTNALYVAVFVALAYLGERTTLSVTPAISQSLSTAVHVAAILLLPAPLPVLATLLAVLLSQVHQTQKPLYKRGEGVS